MKKIISAAAAFLLFQTFVMAQAYEGSLKIKKVEEPAIVMVYNYPADVVENAFNAKLADQRLKGEKSKGFLHYNKSVISGISPAPLDYSFKFEEGGKKGRQATTVYMLMKGDNNLAADGTTMARNAKSFLENMMPGVEKSNTVSQIKKQEELLVKEEKKLKELEEDHKELTKKLKDNEEKQNAQKKVLGSQNSVLNDLKAKNN